MLFSIILSAQAQTDTSRKTFNRIFGDIPYFSVDSIQKQVIRNKKIIGKWKFHSVQATTKEGAKYQAADISKEYSGVTFEFRTDRSVTFCRDTMKNELYWNYSKNEDTLLLYNCTKDKKLFGGTSIPVYKLKRRKFIFKAKGAHKTKDGNRIELEEAMRFKKIKK